MKLKATLIFGHFFTSFFIGLCRICLCAKVRNLVFTNCSLLVGIDCVTDIDKLKATFFLDEEQALLSSIAFRIPRMLKITF